MFLTAEKIYINGIDALTGQYLIEPLSHSEITSRIRADLDKADVDDRSMKLWLKRVWRSLSQAHLGLPRNVDPREVKQAGWGVVFHQNESEAVKKAFEPLMDHRRRQIADDSKVKILEYQNGERRADWLARHEVGAGSIDPTKVPYYLLLVGGPEQIPFSFCHDLDVEYGVGVLHLDTVDDYVRYVESLIVYESGTTIPNPREVVFWATRHEGDGATELSSQYLAKPLASDKGIAENSEFQIRNLFESEATKAALRDIFTRPTRASAPALLFTASHGVGFPKGDAQQRLEQGALLCQDWTGFGSLTSDHYFSAHDLTDDSLVHGMIAFCFACFSAGTPSHDRFVHKLGQAPPAIADKPFLSAFAKRLLSHPRGGALAFIGHVERAWGYSFVAPNAGAQLVPFKNVIAGLLNGEPVGYAMKDFNERYAALATSLSEMLEEISSGTVVSDRKLASSWIERNDAQGYVVIGDPAVKLRV